MTAAMLEVLLSCGHNVKVRAPRPEAGTEVFCRKDNDYGFVLDESQLKVKVRCQDCQMGRAFGTDATAASRSASRHVIRKAHTVIIYRGTRPIEKIGPQRDSLPYDTVRAQRRTLAAHMQSTLRDFVTNSLPANVGVDATVTAEQPIDNQGGNDV